MKRGEEFILRVEKFADRGKVLARKDGFVFFFSGAAPEDLVRIQVQRKKKSYAEARLVEIIEKSPLRTEPVCQHFGICGGCKWQHVRYEAQLEAKRQSVEDALTIHAGFESISVPKVLGMAHPYAYRNKMEFSFSTARWLTQEEIDSKAVLDKSFALGLHIPGRFDKVVDINTCHLQPDIGNRIVKGVRKFAKEQAWEPWDIKKHEGFLRHLVIRNAHATEDLMVNLVTNGEYPERMEQLAQWFQTNIPEITTFVNTINTGVAQTAFGEYSTTIFGTGVIYDCIGSLTFEIAPNAFFQTNTLQASTLYEVTKDFCSLQPTDVVYDLYCGAGTISLFVAPFVQKVVGVELVEEAIENAQKNAVANGIDNAIFYSGDILKIFTDAFIEENGKPDVLIVDPPRAGMHPKVVRQIAQLRAERLVYVSCNPMTQARDLLLLKEMYELEETQPVDLFPHTHHIENVAKLRLK